MATKVLVNVGICPECGDAITSLYRHDYQECKCGASMLDGGTDYCRSTVKLLHGSIQMSKAQLRKIVKAKLNR